MHDNHDVKGRVQKIEQRAQSRKGLKNLHHLPDHDSFDVEFSPSAQVVQQTRYTLGGQVHDSTRFIYGERGELVRTLKFDGTGRELLRTDYLCESEGRCVGWTVYDSAGVLIRRCVQRYACELLVSSATTAAQGLRVRE